MAMPEELENEAQQLEDEADSLGNGSNGPGKATSPNICPRQSWQVASRKRDQADALRSQASGGSSKAFTCISLM